MTSPSVTIKQDPEICVATSEIFKNYLDMPVWQLRHLEVSRFIQKHSIKRILDIGCAEGTLINRLSRSFEIQNLKGIDFDQKVLEKASQNVLPELIQESVGYHRQNPLNIQLYKLNILEDLPLHLFRKIQLVTLIEFIEHIAEQNLDILCKQVFEKIRPPYVIVTTPNSEFNVHFKFKPDQMRHPDHLFQWNRKQFLQFCVKVSEKYAYRYELFGIGQHVNDQSLGPCSQGAYFIKIPIHELKETENKQQELRKVQPFTQVRYPFWKDNIDSKIKNQLISVIIRNNYSTPRQILQSFLDTKIGKKILSEQENLMDSGLNLNFDEKWVIDQSKDLKYCNFDEERNEVYYQYEDSSIEEDQEMEMEQNN